jgi:hypothetical protein
MELSHQGVNVTEPDVDALAVVAERSTSVLAHIMAAKKPRNSGPTRRAGLSRASLLAEP